MRLIIGSRRHQPLALKSHK